MNKEIYPNSGAGVADSETEAVLIEQLALNDLIARYKGISLSGLQSECVAAEIRSYTLHSQEPFRADAAIIGLVRAGEQTLSCNMRTCHLQAGMMFFYSPNAILQVVASSSDFRAQVVVVSTDFIRGLNINLPHLMPRIMQFVSRSCFDLNSADQTVMSRLLALVEHEVKGSEQAFSRDVVRGLLSAIIYKTVNVLLDYYAVHPEEERAMQGRNESYFRRFLELLSKHYRTQRTVGFYASELCITPKYLTTIIKRVSGSSVSDWVDHYVILEAKTLLKNGTMSIQEIAYHLHFPNQSFFGSYFKRLTGLSPSQYRNSD